MAYERRPHFDDGHKIPWARYLAPNPVDVVVDQDKIPHRPGMITRILPGGFDVDYRGQIGRWADES